MDQIEIEDSFEPEDDQEDPVSEVEEEDEQQINSGQVVRINSSCSLQDSRLFKGVLGTVIELNQYNAYKDYRILIVDDQSFNIDAALIILGNVLKLETEVLCTLAYNGKQAI